MTILTIAITPWLLAFPLVPLLALCVYAGVHFRTMPRAFKTLSVFIFFTTVIQVVAFCMWLLVLNNKPLSHLNTAIGSVLLIWFYNEVIQPYLSKQLLKWVALLFLLIAVSNVVFGFESLIEFNAITLTLQCVVMIILSLALYSLILNPIVKQAKAPMIKSLTWINTGVFIYFTGNILLFYFGKVILESFSTIISQYSWLLHSFFATLLYCFLFVGLWKRPRN